MIKLKIGVDWDDVIAPFNSIACEFANKEFNFSPALTINDITSWENTGRASCIKKYYNDQALYNEQSNRISQTNLDCIRELMTIADVYIITAVYPTFMGVRANQIQKAFPDLPSDHIILGAAKHLVKFDILLDDNFCNVLNSPSEFPVLMRKPWNSEATGLLAVNDLSQFVKLVNHILNNQCNNFTIDKSHPYVVAVVGPSGSGKTEIVKEISKRYKYCHLKTYTTNPNDKDKYYLKEEEFEKESFFEKTFYAGYAYGTRDSDINSVVNSGKNPVIALDMCGAIGMKMKYPTIIIYVKNGKENMIYNIVSNNQLTNKEKTLRLLSLDAERKNQELCDYVINTNDPNTIEEQLDTIL